MQQDRSGHNIGLAHFVLTTRYLQVAHVWESTKENKIMNTSFEKYQPVRTIVSSITLSLDEE